MRTLLGDTEWAALETALGQPTPVSIRLNPNRAPQNPALLPESDGAVLWHPQGYYLKERPVFTLDPLFHAGAYYVQEASSMFVYEVLRQTGRLGQSALRVLDLCAAPGGKTTLLNDAIGGSLTANEVVAQRAGILRENLERWGVSDAAVVSAEADVFEKLPGWFDVILVDAPCSGEGLFRKDPNAIKEWSPDNVVLCTNRQRNILDAIEKALAPGGLLIYSTCTYNTSENEGNFGEHCRKYEHSPVQLMLPDHWGVTRSEYGYRFFPHRTKGEGFFIAAFEKEDAGSGKPKVAVPSHFKHLTALPKKQREVCIPWLAQPDAVSLWTTPSGEILALPVEKEADLRALDVVFKSKWFGCPIGTIKGTDFIPSHALALSPLISTQLPKAELTREQALIFLKKETFDPPQGMKGWVMAAYSGLPIGWMKVLPNRMNNYLPAERRIRMSL
jgi:16S rRNA C967 or C1407 C5-methylase (RsmB/RsmF family)/NOL1/NOP2/fmu family ribosome biogenesis protein